MRRIGRAGEKWGAWTLEGRAGVSIADGKRAFWAIRSIHVRWPELTPGGVPRAVVVVQHRGTKRTAWRIDEKMLVPETLLGTFQSWHSMLERCNRPSHVSYLHYGGRGITVCPAWDPERHYLTRYGGTAATVNRKTLLDRISAFASFVGHVGTRPAGCSLDRINVNGNYEPGNVRWACKAVQAFNRRRRAA